MFHMKPIDFFYNTQNGILLIFPFRSVCEAQTQNSNDFQAYTVSHDWAQPDFIFLKSSIGSPRIKITFSIISI